MSTPVMSASPSEQEPPLSREKTAASYSYENVTGWKGVRCLRIGRGMYHDVRRRLPFYWSDISDALTYRTVASAVRMYFVKCVTIASPTNFYISRALTLGSAFSPLSHIRLTCTGARANFTALMKACSLPHWPLWYLAYWGLSLSPSWALPV